MKEPLKDRVRLEHIVEAIHNICSYTEGKSVNDLTNDSMLFYAVVKNIEIIGEAAYNITKAFREAHPETEWDEIMKMRHVLVHDYYRINPQLLWSVIQKDISLLKEQVTRYIVETNWEEWEKNEQVVTETAIHKNLIQTASRMKKDGMPILQISRYTGLSAEEIEEI